MRRRDFFNLYCHISIPVEPGCGKRALPDFFDVLPSMYIKSGLNAMVCYKSAEQEATAGSSVLNGYP
jgi:hypothetical protein